MSKIILKGSLYGVNVIKTYSNPDISYSVVDKNICNMNNLSIKYNIDKNNFYIYFSYNSINDNFNKKYSGRWYSLDFIPNSKTLNYKDKSLNISISNSNTEWENFDTNQIQKNKKNIKIKIFLNEKGFEKLIKILQNII